VASGATLSVLVVRSDRVASVGDLAAHAAEVVVVAAREARGIFDTTTSQGVLGLLERPRRTLDDVLGARGLLVLDGVSDPGNVGTLVRTAAGLGEGLGVVVGPESADPFGPKAARAAAGALAWVPVVEVVDLAAALRRLAEEGFLRVGLDAHAPRRLEPTSRRVVLVVGSEAQGIAPATREHLDELRALVVPPRVESLNAAIAGAIALWQVLGLGGQAADQPS